jgi:hypothetical protein
LHDLKTCVKEEKHKNGLSALIPCIQSVLSTSWRTVSNRQSMISAPSP